jgi:hypothetical protein
MRVICPNHHILNFIIEILLSEYTIKFLNISFSQPLADFPLLDHFGNNKEFFEHPNNYNNLKPGSVCFYLITILEYKSQ